MNTATAANTARAITIAQAISRTRQRRQGMLLRMRSPGILALGVLDLERHFLHDVNWRFAQGKYALPRSPGKTSGFGHVRKYLPGHRVALHAPFDKRLEVDPLRSVAILGPDILN